MEGIGILWSVTIGILAGGIAGLLTEGKGFGMFINLIIGLIGGVMGGWVCNLCGLQTTGLPAILIMSIAGAAILLGMLSFFIKIRN